MKSLLWHLFIFFLFIIYISWGFPGGASSEEPGCQCRRHKRRGFDPWGRKLQPTPVFLPGESHGQRSLVSYSPWGHKESDMTERLTTFTLSLQLLQSRNFTCIFVYFYPFCHCGSIIDLWCYADFCCSAKWLSSVTQSCPTLSDPMDCSPPARSVHSGSDGKELACNAGDPGSTPGLRRSLKKWMATHSSILAWRIPGTEEPDGLQSTGSKRVRQDWVKRLFDL